MQSSLAKSANFTGVGLHSGRPVRLKISPAPVDHGIVFRRTDLHDACDIRATWNNVIVSPLNTRLESETGVTISTIEHVMAALAGLGINNALVTVDGPEVPILDGSAAPFVRGMLRAGRVTQAAPLKAIEILAPVRVGDADGFAELTPADGLEIDFTIDFPDAAIGHQHKSLAMANGAFLRELCDSRTFCRRADVEAMHAAGKALGGSYDNAVVVDGADVLSPGGLRHPDEAVRHKMLDALGDLYTAGAPILGRYTGVKAGHAMTNGLLRALFDQPDCWRWITVSPQQARRLPGSGVTHSDLAVVA